MQVRDWRDGLKAFFDVYVREDPTAVVLLDVLYGEYVSFCRRNKIAAVSKTWLGRYLQKKGYMRVLAKGDEGKYQRAYRGLRLCKTQS